MMQYLQEKVTTMRLNMVPYLQYYLLLYVS